jgi:DHA2 family multidrug resistance protein
MFIPLSVATLGSVPRNEVAAASGLYNLTRQIGGSIGIAVLATFLDHRTQFHAQNIAAHVSAYDQRTRAFLQQIGSYAQQMHGYDAPRAAQLGIKLTQGLVMQQGAIMAFEDVYILVGAMFICSLGLLFFLGRGRAGQKLPDAH